MTKHEAIEVLEEVKMLDDSMFAYSQAYHDALDMAIEALKAQEPIEARLNLCESCAKEYAECEADKTDLVYGSGVGNDNIIGCPWYVNRWKAQEPVEPTEPDEDNMRYCGACGSPVGYEVLEAPGIEYVQYSYCPNCGRAVKWE